MDYLQTVTDSANDLGKLIDALLAFSKLNRSEIHKIPLDTVQMIRQELSIYAEEITKRQVEIHIQEMLGSYGDRQLLRQVWANLISNALKYTGNTKKPIIEIGSYLEHGDIIYFVR